ncbi:DUF4955 domain-containing protein [Lentisphaerota bacterium WC36G]|nr:DUF4955 domain-containing protein [Lentisphaerae bacterium WC36]
MRKKITNTVLLAALCGIGVVFSGCQHHEAATWIKFKEQKKANLPTDLADYSYAGYKFGNCEIPDKLNWKVFNVIDYGAVPNDQKSDKEAIQKAVDAAEANGSGIIFFPPGVFRVSEEPNVPNGIYINSSNILIKGSGSTPGGTVIYMKHAHVPAEPNVLWKVSRVFNFQPADKKREFSISNRSKLVPLAKIVKNVQRDQFSVIVSEPRKFRVGQSVMIATQSKILNRERLAGLCTRPIWKEINEKGIAIAEKYVIKKVNGNELTFTAPLKSTMTIDLDWKIYDYPTLENWGVEDIHFVGNFREKFIHHKDACHDSGFGMISMRQGVNCWIRRNRVTNSTNAFSFTGCIGSSMLLNSVDGYQGHTNFTTNWGYGNLIGLSQDFTDIGTWHGPGISHEMTGAVVWRYTSLAKFYGGPDYHARFPHTSLWDNSIANLNNSGGNYTRLPLHLNDLTYWNFTPTRAHKNIDFWGLPVKDEDRKKKYFGLYIAYPNIIGFNSTNSTINEKHVNLLESFGKKVYPRSLYEDQLQLRLGRLPKWVKDSKKEWKSLQKVYAREAKEAKNESYLNNLLKN